MKQVRFLKDVESFKAGQVALVENNVAHRLIDSGAAELTSADEYHDRMMGGRNKGSEIKNK